MFKLRVVAASIAALLIGCDSLPEGSAPPPQEEEGGAPDLDNMESKPAAVPADATDPILDVALTLALDLQGFTGA